MPFQVYQQLTILQKYLLVISFEERAIEWIRGLRSCNFNRKVQLQTPLGTRPELGTQPYYQAPSDLEIETVEKQ